MILSDKLVNAFSIVTAEKDLPSECRKGGPHTVLTLNNGASYKVYETPEKIEEMRLDEMDKFQRFQAE